MDTDERSREARARAERALVELALAFGTHAQDLIVIGGLNPDFLAPNAPVPHLGTTDVDILLELGYIWDRDDLNFSWLAPALKQAGFEPKTIDAWQWLRDVDDAVVRIDILCDVADSQDQAIALPGTREVSAKNLLGRSGALASPVLRELTVDAASRNAYPDAGESITLRFASLGGYLLAKSSALVTRKLPKDAYDLLYVVLFNPEGPRGAARAIENAILEETSHFDQRANIVAALRGFETHEYAEWFAEQMQLSGDDSSLRQLLDEARRGAAFVLRELES